MLNFNLWLEQKETRRIMYHGTTSKLLASIMSEGLIPYPKNRTWSDDPDSSFDNPSRASYGGIYVTTNIMTAVSSAGKISRQTKSNSLIVCMDIHPYSLIADEDNVTYYVNKLVIPGLLTTEYGVSGLYASWIILQNREFVKQFIKNHSKFNLKEQRDYLFKAKKQYVEDSIKKLMYNIEEIEQHPELVAAVKSLLETKGFEATLIRHSAYIDQYTLQKAFDYFGYKGEVKVPDKAMAEQKYKEFVDQLSRTLKKISYPRANRNSSFKHGRLEKTINFTGKDKIVCIVEDWYVQGQGTFSYVHYGQPPQQFIKDWQSTVGEWKPTDKLPQNKLQ